MLSVELEKYIRIILENSQNENHSINYIYKKFVKSLYS